MSSHHGANPLRIALGREEQHGGGDEDREAGAKRQQDEQQRQRARTEQRSRPGQIALFRRLHANAHQRLARRESRVAPSPRRRARPRAAAARVPCATRPSASPGTRRRAAGTRRTGSRGRTRRPARVAPPAPATSATSGSSPRRQALPGFVAGRGAGRGACACGGAVRCAPGGLCGVGRTDGARLTGADAVAGASDVPRSGATEGASLRSTFGSISTRPAGCQRASPGCQTGVVASSSCFAASCSMSSRS